MKTYTYKDKTYNNLYDLSEAMGQDGTFIPLSISDADLGCLGVAIGEVEEPLENVRAHKIFELKAERDSKEALLDFTLTIALQPKEEAAE